MADPWETKITEVKPNKLSIRGYKLDDLIGNVSYTMGIFLLLRGRLPSESEQKVFNAILVATMDHGVTAPSAVAARTVASCGVPITTALAAGILAVGDYHGGAGEQCMRYLQTILLNKPENQSLPELAERAVKSSRERKERIPGYGHRYHTDDPRTKKLLEIAKESNIIENYTTLALLIENELQKQSGRILPLNVDGAIGALLGDMGFPPEVGKAIFAISRITGLTAHVLEELKERPVRTIIPEQAKYTGPQNKKI
ncbi:MAG: citryl-CoA lyase [Candidatus Heimdallarchaeota archaeon]|nr:citryl-CoA lyase [Candidatus Heimdallarchaeota archaeon]